MKSAFSPDEDHHNRGSVPHIRILDGQSFRFQGYNGGPHNELRTFIHPFCGDGQQTFLQGL